ncbi:MAG: hypothetical protein H6736_24725, partial [Alphaproteobacteria bacterium]|nr:hypothetical protein [Alphaproteobacteria bacterium]MCB9695021.1 hypothetical protein [Alphaproteobacteria bacterium]
MRSASPLVLLALSVGGCAFVTEGEVDSVTSSIDSDGDGVVDVEDCVSDDASIFPRGQDFIDGSPNCRVETETGAEVADGIDNDCSCSDDVDGDDDDYPAVAEPVYRELASAVQGRTPETVPWPA